MCTFIHDSLSSLEGAAYERTAARGIIMRGSNILLLYTQRYNDYSFPGGGIDRNEDAVEALLREIREETGAVNVRVLSEYGYIDEYRPHYKPEYDLMHMLSYFYICNADEQLGDADLEDYEVANGMSAIWINIHEAIAHNREVIAAKEACMGLSIQRETWVMEQIVKDLL
ncbi:NUDIX domain-containing protein [Paenibacillus chungangensis]|uniref:NUDIX domain-containing protein n=1 Tax=Paenibacillus chungangensis TaxID=696535 RepID=A0ABW3HKW1_9BACL